MITLLSGITWKTFFGSADDDWVDQANHLWTVLVLMVMALIVSSGQYIGSPIHCWCPAEFKPFYIDYVHNYCWIANTYSVPMEHEIPTSHDTRYELQINYYQWVPLIFLLMAAFFKAPNVLWHLLNTHTGVHPSKICDLIENINIGEENEREATLMHIALNIDRWVRECREYRKTFFVKLRSRFTNVFLFCLGKREGCFLTGLYVFVKLLYCANCIGQFFLLDLWLGLNFGGYGFELIGFYRETGEFKETPRFPRVTLCDLEVRQLPNVQTYTIQCVLPINLFNEKIFAVVWFWIFFLSILTFYNLVSWLCYLLFSHNKEMFVIKYLRNSNIIQDNFDKKLARRFANNFLRDDGCFVLRIIGKNSTDIILSDIMSLVWLMFLNDPYPRYSKAYGLTHHSKVIADHVAHERSDLHKLHHYHSIMKGFFNPVKLDKAQNGHVIYGNEQNGLPSNGLHGNRNQEQSHELINDTDIRPEERNGFLSNRSNHRNQNGRINNNRSNNHNVHFSENSNHGYHSHGDDNDYDDDDADDDDASQSDDNDEYCPTESETENSLNESIEQGNT